MARSQLGELAGQPDRAGRPRLNERQRVDRTSEPAGFDPQVTVHPPDGIRDRFFTQPELVDGRLFAEPHDRRSHVQLVFELVEDARAHQRLFLNAEEGIGLVVDADISAGGQEGGVGDADCTALIVHHIVGPFLQGRPAGGHPDGPLYDAGKGIQAVEILHGALVGPVDLIHVELRISPGVLFLPGIQVRENELVDGFLPSRFIAHGFVDLIFDAISERLQIREDQQSVARIDRVIDEVVEAVVGPWRFLDVEAVEAENLEERFSTADAGQRLRGRLSRSTVLNLQLEVVRIQTPPLERVNVAHLQIPGSRVRTGLGVRLRVRGRAEQLQDEPRIAFRLFARKLAHLKALAVRYVLVGHGERFEGFLYRGAHRDVAEDFVERVIAAFFEFLEKLAGLVVLIALVPQRVELFGRDGRFVVDIDLRSRQIGFQVIVGFGPDGGFLAEVDDGKSVAELLLLSRRADEFPYFDPGDAFEAVRHGNQRRFDVRLLPAVAEIIGQEKVGTFDVIRRPEVEADSLGSAVDVEAVGLALLLADNGLKLNAAELEFTFDAEEALAAADQGRRRLEEDVPGLDALDDIVVVTLVTELELVLVIEVALRIPVDVDVHLVSDRADDAEAEVLPELGIDLGISAGEHRLLVAFAYVEAGVDVGLPVDAQVDVGRAEDGRERAFSPTGHHDVEAQAAAVLLVPSSLRRLFGQALEFAPDAYLEAPEAIGVVIDDQRIANVPVADVFTRDDVAPRRIQGNIVVPVVAQLR